MTDPDLNRGDVGIDIGKRRLAIGWPYWGMSYSIDLKKPGQRDSELRSLQRWMSETLPTGCRLWIEQPYLSNGPGANQTVTIGMAETVGIVQAAAPWVEVHMVGQSTWKAQVCGNGRADKQEVSDWLAFNHPTLFHKCLYDQDRIDAMCIGLYGMMRSNGEIAEPVKKPKPKRKKKASDG